MLNIGKRLKTIRLQRKMTQKELAEKSGVSRESIGNYERGDRIPTIEVINKIANAFNITVGELTGTRTTFSQRYLNRLLDQGCTLKDISKKTGISEDRLKIITTNGMEITGEEFMLLFNPKKSNDESLNKLLDFILYDDFYSYLTEKSNENINTIINNWAAYEGKTPKEAIEDISKLPDSYIKILSDYIKHMNKKEWLTNG